MRILKKRIVVCGLLFSQVFCGQAWANERNNICYQNNVDMENSDFYTGEWKYKFTSSSGFKVMLEEGKKHIFLIINGRLFAEDIIIENERAFIELKTLCSALGLHVSENKKMIIVENDSDIVTVNLETLEIMKNGVALDSKGIYANHEIYIPVRSFSVSFGASVTYSLQKIMPMGNPFINIENRDRKISREIAVNSVKEKTQKYFQQFQLSNAYKNLIPYNEIGNTQIQEKIKDIRFVDETASFWIVGGSQLFLVDKVVGTIYYKTGDEKVGHGSYIETIGKLDETYEDLFKNILLYG